MSKKQTRAGLGLWMLSLMFILAMGEASGAFGLKNGDSAEDVLPSAYDSREVGRCPEVKSQGERSICWALSAVSAMEAAVRPERELRFSAEHMVENSGFTGDPEDGGDYKMIMACLSGWREPVAMVKEPEEAEEPVSEAALLKGQAVEDPAVHVQDIRLLNDPQPELIKEMILKYGAVQTSLYMNRSLTKEGRGYYNEEHFAYAYPETHKPDHDVIVIGWDDRYPKENFDAYLTQNGAWICQNTWGEDFGQQGIFYVSYADANVLRSGLVYQRIDPVDNYDRIYQQDLCGWQARLGYDRENGCMAAVYQAQDKEKLRAAGIYTVGEETAYEICLVHDYSSPDDLIGAGQIQTGKLSGSGWHTIDLNVVEDFEPGEVFALVVNIETKGEKKPIAAEVKRNRYTQNVSFDGKESFISLDGKKWVNTQSEFQANVCLKVFTDMVE